MRTFAVYKPYGVLSQFTSEDGHPGLLDLGLSVPKDVWPVGRLDRDSEGLLLLTNDNHLKRTLTEPERSHRKTYWVQVEGAPTDADIEPLRHQWIAHSKERHHHEASGGKPTRPTRCTRARPFYS